MRAKFLYGFQVLVDAELATHLADAAVATGLSKSEVARRWLRQGRVADLLLAAPAPRPVELVTEAHRLLGAALETFRTEESPHA